MPPWHEKKGDDNQLEKLKDPLNDDSSPQDDKTMEL